MTEPEAFEKLVDDMLVMHVRLEGAGLVDLSGDFLQLLKDAGLVMVRKGREIHWKLHGTDVNGWIKFE